MGLDAVGERDLLLAASTKYEAMAEHARIVAGMTEDGHLPFHHRTLQLTTVGVTPLASLIRACGASMTCYVVGATSLPGEDIDEFGEVGGAGDGGRRSAPA